MGWWWLLPGIVGSGLLYVAYELYRDRRNSGEWIWQTWRRERRTRDSVINDDY